MSHHSKSPACNTPDHYSRRTLLKAGGLLWLTPVSDLLALDAESAPDPAAPPKSIIILWLAGGPSQVDTFDPHPASSPIQGPKSIPTAAKDIELAAGFEQTAELMDDISLIRSVVSKEGDHERAFYNIKTGYRPNPSVAHPSIGAIVSHELAGDGIDIPTHISILPNQWPGRGGHLGAQFDAFQVGDPGKPVPDISTEIPKKRQQRRLNSLDIVEKAFAQGRPPNLDREITLHNDTIAKGRRMMSSDQLKAFDLSEVLDSEKTPYGDTPFGRGCLAALRLVQAGVRCVEVTLSGWDSHINNAELQAGRVKILDPAFAALIRDLKSRGLFENTVVVCGGEFGRTPKLNALDGRDHWPHAFSIAVAGGGLAGGRVIGETDPQGDKKEPASPVAVADVHATIQHTLGINHETELMTSIGRPIALSDGKIIKQLL
ncbi:MAG: DUF1501 domain-containing protein [Verrucomicrobiota bacterium]